MHFAKSAVCAMMIGVAGAAVAAQEKTTIAIMTLKNNGGLNEGEVNIVSDRINFAVVHDGGFVVLEREQMDQVLKEQGFQISGSCSDQQCLVEIGQLLAVQQIVSGSIGRFGNMYSITLKLVSVSSGKILSQATADVKGSKENMLSKAIPALVNDLLRGAAAASVKSTTSDTSGNTSVHRKRSLAANPLFWIGVGGVAAVGAGIAVLAASQSDPQDNADGAIDVGLPSRPSVPFSP